MPRTRRRAAGEGTDVIVRMVALATSVFFASFRFSLACAAEWYVNGAVAASGDGTSWQKAFKTIREGIHGSSDGDTVLVAQGIYVENIDFKGKNITLTSLHPALAGQSGVVANTIIDGNRMGPVVSFSGSEGETCVLAGFTIRNGHADYGGGIRGGTWDNPTHATLRNNVIVANWAENGGGLAFCDGVIRNNIISHNVVRGYGGGLWGCHGTIENNTISGNWAGSHGGGLYCCYGTIRNSIVWGNRGLNQFSYCSTPSYCCIESWGGEGDGNIAHYPYFADAPGGDYHLRSWSPCIDAGDPSSPFSEEPEPNGGRINIGAYGNTPEATSASPDSDHDGLPDDWERNFFGDVARGPSDDSDGDSISNMEEYQRGLDPTVPSAVWYVDGRASPRGDGKSWQTAFQSIQEGINSASEGDTVIVSQWVYRENIRSRGKNIFLRSRDPLDRDVVARTIIDGSKAGAAVTFSGDESYAFVLEGFTIRNGNADNGGGICGGTPANPTHATIRNNVITGNFAVREWPHGYGGGLAFCNGVVENNVIAGNAARHGGGLYSCGGTIRNNIIAHNSASQNAGAMMGCHGIIENNTIVRNWAGFVGGLYNCDGIIRNCIVWANSGEQQLYDCRMPSYCCIARWPGLGEGNISYYPYFVDAARGDYHLKSWSPCIDAGDPASPFSREPCGTQGGRVNMGAYGNTPEAACRSPDSDEDGLPDEWEIEFFGSLSQKGNDDPDGDLIANVEEYHRGLDPSSPVAVWYVDGSAMVSGDGTTWESAFKTVQDGLDAARNGDTVLVSPAVYGENIRFNGKNVVLRSSDPLDPLVVASTIIDGGGAGSAVTFDGTEDESCLLTGFTIRNGGALYGGGICGNGTRATIRNNTISGNSADWYGGGLAECDGTVEQNIISGNSAFEGGGLAYCAGTIRHNLIASNFAEENGGGLCSCGGDILNNIIWSNTAGGSGGGLSRCGGRVQNNTIVGNSAPNGGGLHSCYGTIVNCIIWGNGGSQLHLSAMPTYCCIEDWTGGGEGNMAFHPYFVDAERGDFHLRTWSPCIDAGDPSSPFSNEPCATQGGRVDMGAYGNTREATCKSPDTDGDGLPDDWELALFGNLGQGADGDPDGDRIPNMVEYLYGWHPGIPEKTIVGNLTKARWYRTIRAAVLESDDGDEIVVYPGTYAENVGFGGKNIVLRSADPSDPKVVAGTIIDGGQRGPVVTFAGTEDERCVLSGLTIRNGKAKFGGGIAGNGTNATIENNAISQNSADADGGGLHGCHGKVQSNAVSANSAGRCGGGLYDCGGTIRENAVSGNTAGYEGGGLAYCDGTVSRNKIANNTAAWGGGLSRCHAVVEKNRIENNKADQGGGGLHASSRVVRNNIISGNRADSGGGVHSCNGTIENNTIYGNVAARQGGGLFGCHGVSRNCIIWGNIAPDGEELLDCPEPTYSCVEDGQGGGVGNISIHPYFVSARDGDFHLHTWSPCIDAGDPTSPFSEEPQPNGGRINMGAYGNTPEATCASPDSDRDGLPDDWEMEFFGDLAEGPDDDPDHDRVSTIEEYREGTNPAGLPGWHVDASVLVSGDGTSWRRAFKTIQMGINAASDGETVFVAPGTYRENVYIGGKNIVLTSTDPLDPSIVAGTIIDGQQFLSAVTFGGTEGPNCVLSGFTICNGKAAEGGGIAGNGAWATIVNNIVTANSAGGYGGGLARCHGTIQDNVIAGNSAKEGGGLAFCYGSILENAVASNSAEYGGGLAWCNAIVRRNTIRENAATSGGGGLFRCKGAVQNNLIEGNSAVAWGGAVYGFDGTAQNNVITGNSASGGGALYECSGLLENNTIAYNSALSGGGVHSCNAPIRNCIIWNISSDGRDLVFCVEPTYSCLRNWPGEGRGNMSVHPHFVDPNAGDYHLRSWSPCIDAGDPSSDFSNEPQPNGGRINMGAYGNTPEAECRSADSDSDGLPDDWEMFFFGSLVQGPSDDADGDGRANLDEYRRGTNPAWVVVWYVDGSVASSGDGKSWQTAFKRVQEGIEAASEGDIVIVAEGIYDENIHFGGRNIVLTSEHPHDPQVAAGTVLDGQGRVGPVVGFAGTEDETCILRGFTIRGGNGTNGGAISGNGTRARLEYNIVTGNSATKGGGIYGCDGIIRNNAIVSNSAADGGGIAYCKGTIQNNVVAANSASRGGGIAFCSGPIINNTIVGNSSAARGGGVHSCGGKISNCIIWGNTAESYPQLSESSSPSYSCIQNWRTGGLGNISGYPYFVDAGAGDYHVKSWSPCIDAGDPSSDFSNEPQPNGGRINMGAYGNTPEAACRSADSDSDGLPDDWEMFFFGSLAQEASGDADEDGRSNLDEYRRGTNPAWVVVWYVDASVVSSGDGKSWETAFKKVQEGIDAASDGDIVIVAEGTYVENIRFCGKSIVLTSTNPEDWQVVAKTILDGDGAGSVVTFAGMEDETCVLAGFTIRDGSGQNGGGICGGTSSIRTHAAILRNIITGNSARLDGGGIAYCGGFIHRNIIHSNSADGDGGGMAFCDGILKNNVVTGNSATYDGGGLAYCDGTIENNTITGNTARYGAAGVYGCRGTIRNCIIWGNTAGLGYQLYDCGAVTYSCIQNWRGGGEGNISACPYFVDPAGGDYHLRSWSPCIDAGDPSSDFSKEPQPNGGRINMGAYGNTPEAECRCADSDGDSLPDDWEMFFFGSLAQEASGDADEDGRSNLDEYRRGTNPAWVVIWYVDGSVASSGDGKSWETAFKKVQEGIDAALEGDIVIVAEGTYVENIDFRGNSIILRSTKPYDPAVVTKTVISAAVKKAVVTFSGREDEACLLFGFTVRGGNPYGTGGGICGGDWDMRTHATIIGNVIIGNSAERGGGIGYCDGIIRNNVVTGNSATYDGGGLAYCDGTIENNTITGNTARYGASGVYGCRGTIRNCIIWGNGGTSQLSECAVPTYSCIRHWTGGGEGNIPYFPYFVDAANGDYHLRSWSPCIDSGDPSSDFSNEPQPNGGRINMGAYGNTPEAECRSLDTDGDGLPDDWETFFFSSLAQGPSDDADGDCRSNLEEYRYGSDPAQSRKWYVDGAVASPGDGTSWQTAFKTVQEGVNAASEGDTVIVAEGTYVENVRFPSAPTVGETIFYENFDAFTNLYTFKDVVNSGWEVRNGSGCPEAAWRLWWTEGDLMREESPNISGMKDKFMITNSDVAPEAQMDEELITREIDCSGWVNVRLHFNKNYRAFIEDTVHLQAADVDVRFWEGTRWSNWVNLLRFDRKMFEPGTDPAIDSNPEGVDISPYADGKKIQIRWHFYDAVYDWWFAIDEITVSGKAAGQSPAASAQGGHRSLSRDAKNISLRSNDPFDPAVVANTIVDGGGKGPVVSLLGTEEEACVLAGFTIRNGSAEAGGGICGGTSYVRTHATILCNVITGNSARLDGGGIAYCDGLIQENIIRGNSAGDDGGGLASCDGTIQNNVISSNSAYDGGGGIFYCGGIIENNTVADNSASSGGGVAYCYGLIRNCIVWGNKGKGQTLDCSVVSYSCIQHWTGGGEGNISYFPYFVDAANGDYHLKSWSPCVDAGDPSCDFSNEPQPNGARIDMGAYGNTPEATSACPDSDNDGLPDEWEREFFGQLAEGASDDPDGDSRTNLQEYRHGTNPATVVVWYVDGAVASSGDGKSWERAFKKVQEGIEAASESDIVIVAAGTYVENVLFRGMNVVLTSSDALDEKVVASTILDGNQAGSVVTFTGTEDETCILSGFTIRNGKADYGGGIAGRGTRATIENNVVTKNSAARHGGGLHDCDGVVRYNVITGNSASRDGGGLAYCDGTIHHNSITGNSSSTRDGGGLAYCGGTIENNTVAENSAKNSGGGLRGCAGRIANNIVCRNSAGYGGGLSLCSGIVENNIVCGNASASRGGGLYDCNGTIQSNTVFGNSAESQGGGLFACKGTIVNCIIWGNKSPDGAQLYECVEPTYCCIQGWQGGGVGNISFYPYFFDAAGGDFHLKSWSPCIDAGDPASDFSNEPEPNGGRVDMGAYGNTSEATSESPDADSDGLPDDWEMEFLGSLADGPDDDPDGDSTSNIEEYRVGSRPHVFDSFRRSILRITRTAGGEIQITWASVAERTYVVWSCLDLVSGQWTDEGTVLSSGSETTWSDADATSQRKFYRIEAR